MNATIRDIARIAGVTTATVSYVLNRKPNSRISKATQQKVLKAAKSLDYSPHLHARSLATGRSQTIATYFVGPLDSVMVDPYTIDILRGIAQKASVSHYAVQVAVEGHLPHQHGLDGWVCVSARQPMTHTILQDSPAVYLDPWQDFGSDCFWARNSEAGRLLAERTSAVHSRVLFLLHEPVAKSPFSYRERFEAFKTAYSRRHGMRSVSVDHLQPESSAEDYGRFVERWIPKMRKSRITLVACVSDMLASKVQQLMLRAGMRVPADVAVAGFDNTTHSQMAVPSISTVDLGAEQLGAEAARCLIEKIEGRQTHLTAPAPRWIPRASCPIE